MTRTVVHARADLPPRQVGHQGVARDAGVRPHEHLVEVAGVTGLRLGARREIEREIRQQLVVAVPDPRPVRRSSGRAAAAGGVPSAAWTSVMLNLNPGSSTS